MIEKFKEWAGVIALLAIILTWAVPSPEIFGATGTRMPNGISADSTSPVAGQVRGTTLTVTGLATFSGTAKFGADGTVLDNQILTTCSMKADNSITATTSGYAYCTGVTGVTSSDYVQASFATSTKGHSAFAENFVILDAYASTTAGAIDFRILNLSGADATMSANGRLGSTTVIRAGN